MNNTCDIAVVGAGASGLVAAIAAARAAKQAGVPQRVLLLEAQDRVGKPILKTGNGRCNFSNEHIAALLSACDYRNPAFVAAALDALNARFESSAESDADAVLDFFEAIGLEWRQESDGRRYPLANKASSVLDVLRAAAQHEGVEEVCDARVTGVQIHAGEKLRFSIQLANTQLIHASSIVLACGAQAQLLSGLDALQGMQTQPVLGPLQATAKSQAWVRELDNIRVKANALLMRERHNQLECVGSASGEVLFRTYGLSGICIFDLSRHMQPGDTVLVDMLQLESFEHARSFMHNRAQALAQTFGNVSYDCLLRGLVLPRVADVVLKRLGMQGQDLVSSEGIDRVADILAGFPVEIEGIGPKDQCQVQRGGFLVDQFSATTLEAKDIPGLFAAGEALDVDGPCGGYNLHWAWASGLLAGTCAAEQQA